MSEQTVSWPSLTSSTPSIPPEAPLAAVVADPSDSVVAAAGAQEQRRDGEQRNGE
ncbi:MAG: hypothetical protein V9E94_04620 [Microthrixaceae bacterium]